MIICFLLFFLIPTAEIMFLNISKKKETVLAIHIAMVALTAGYLIFRYINTFREGLSSLQLKPVGICILVGLAVYILDLALKNIILNDVLILDPKYYFYPKKKAFLPTILSVILAFGEEVVFRFPLCLFETGIGALFLIGSLSFGCIHLFFSKYDMTSKCILGLILGITCIAMKTYAYAAVVHIIYNISVGLFGGMNLEVRKN